MGVQESKEEAQETLQNLTNMNDADFESVLKQLDTISKVRYDLQISKWDLMQLMKSLSSIQIKKIMQLITRKPEPNTVGIHPLEIALILSRKQMSREEKVKRIFTNVCYEVSPGRIQFSEVDYVFHLMYNWIQSTTGLVLQSSAVQESTRNRMYDKNKETVSMEETIVWVSKHDELDALLSIYTKQTRAQLTDFKPQMVMQLLSHERAANHRNEIQSHQSQGSELHKKSGKIVKSPRDSGMSASKLKVSASKKMSQGMSSETKSPKNRSMRDIDIKSQSVASPRVLVTEFHPNLHQPQKQLLWNAKILTQMNHMFIGHEKRGTIPNSKLKQMQEKLSTLKEMKQLLQEDRVSNLIDLNNKFETIETTNMEFYGQRQLTFMMRSLFYEKELVNSNYSILNFVKSPNACFEDDQSMNDIDTEESLKFKEVLTRAQMSKSFKEFYRQNLSEIKYEMQMHQMRLLQLISSRGTRRILEKKKYKCLGEINLMTKILDEIRRRNDIKKQMAAAARAAIKGATTTSNTDTFRNFMGTGLSGMGQDAGSKGEQSSDNEQHTARGNEKEKKREDKSIIPEQDWFYTMVYKELDQLRASGMSRKDFIELQVSKNEKTRSVRTSFFLEGAMASLRYVNQVQTFKEMVEFSEFLFLTEKVYHEEIRVQKTHLNNRQQSKENYNEFCSQLGKLKGLHFIMRQIQVNIDEKELISALKKRLQDLFNRLEGIDVKLVQTIEEHVVKKRCSKLYFMALGKLAVYKCISKGLNPKYLTNYLAMALAKFRIFELLEMVSNAKAFPQSHESASNTFSELNGNFFKILKQVEIDRYFNLEMNSTDSAINYDKFQDDMIQIAEDERQQAAMTQYNQEKTVIENQSINSTSQNDFTVDEIVPTVTEMMKKYLLFHRKDRDRIGQFHDFVLYQVEWNSKNLALFEKDSEEQTNLNELISKASCEFFNFVDMEDVFQKDEEQFSVLIKYLRTLSTGFQQADFSTPMQKMLDGLLEAHTDCRNYAIEMQRFLEPTYIEQFKEGRFKTFDAFMVSLRKANRGHFINNYNMYHMSMPLEHSLRNNFWLVFSLSSQLDYLEKEEKFQVLLQTSSREMESRRSGKLGASEDFHPNLTMGCFWQNPCGLFTNPSVNISNPKQVNTLQEEFRKQYLATKSSNHRETRIRQMLYGDLANYFETKTTTRKIFIEIIDQLFQMRAKTHDLRHLQSQLYDLVYKNEEFGNDLQTRIQKHLELKMKVTDKNRHQAITGTLQGAEEFLDLIIKNHVEAGSQNPDVIQTLQTLKNQIAAITKTHCYNNTNRKNVAKNAQPSSVSLAFHHSKHTDDADQQKASPTKSVPKSALNGMLEKAQDQLMKHIVQTSCYYKLIGQASQSLNLFQFFDDIEQLKKNMQEEMGRRSTIADFLQLNSQIDEDSDGEFLNSHVKLLGGRIVQDMLAGLTVSSTFAYMPFEEAEYKPEPTIASQDYNSTKSNMISPKSSVTKKKVTVKKSKIKEVVMVEEVKLELAQVPELRKSIQSLNLSGNQLAMNLTLNFLNEICLMDDKLTAKQILKNNKFFTFLQIARITLDSSMAQFNLTENLQLGLSRLLNVFEVHNTPLKRYLINFERISKFIQQELVPKITSTDESHLKFFFFDIMSKKGSALVKQTINKVETYFSLAELQDEDKLNFSTAQTKIKRDLDHNLRTFKEFIDLEDNKKVAKRHQSMIKHQELRLMHEVASLLLLVRTYYLKQNPTAKPTMLNQIRGEQPF